MAWSFSLPEPNDAKFAAGRSDTTARNQIPGTRTQSLKADWLPRPFQDRAYNQLTYFASGVGLFCLSVFITRRAVVSRYRAMKPAGHFSSSRELPQANSAADAASALVLATLNVSTFGAMLAGGAMWGLDISDIEDLRRYVRRDASSNPPTTDHDEKQDDIEAWMTFFSNSIQGKADASPESLVKAVARLEEQSGKT